MTVVSVADGGEVDEVLPELPDDLREALFGVARSNPGRSVEGVLVGTTDGDSETSVAGYIPAGFGADPFSDESWARIQEQVASEYSGQQIVGWYRSRPGAGIGLGPSDLHLHQARFPEPFAFLYAFHPVGMRARLYGWRGGRMVELAERRGDSGWRALSAAPAALGVAPPITTPARSARTQRPVITTTGGQPARPLVGAGPSPRVSPARQFRGTNGKTPPHITTTGGQPAPAGGVGQPAPRPLIVPSLVVDTPSKAPSAPQPTEAVPAKAARVESAPVSVTPARTAVREPAAPVPFPIAPEPAEAEAATPAPAAAPALSQTIIVPTRPPARDFPTRLVGGVVAALLVLVAGGAAVAMSGGGTQATLAAPVSAAVPPPVVPVADPTEEANDELAAQAAADAKAEAKAAAAKKQAAAHERAVKRRAAARKRAAARRAAARRASARAAAVAAANRRTNVAPAATPVRRAPVASAPSTTTKTQTSSPSRSSGSGSGGSSSGGKSGPGSASDVSVATP